MTRPGKPHLIPVPHSQDDISVPGRKQSLKNKLQQKFQVIEGGRAAVDPYSFGAQFPDRWCDFLHAHYRDPVEVAHVYRVSAPAAQKWWDGVGGPNGAKVALAYQWHPDGAARFLSGAA